jgi:nitrogen regulatory protein P-II 1
MECSHIDHGHRNGPALSVYGATYLSRFVEKARLEIVVAADAVGKLYAVKSALQQLGAEEFMESTLLCHGRQEGRAMSYRGIEYASQFVEKVKIEFLAPLDAVEMLLEAIGDVARTEGMEDWRLYVIPEVFPIALTVSQHA